MLRKILQSPVSRGQSLVSLRTVATAMRLKYNKFGDPTEVLYLCEEEIEAPLQGEVLVKILAAAINPADINMIQGKYPVKPQFPAIGGNEGVAEVVAVGTGVTKVKTGDRVVPFATGLGTWTSYAKFCENDVMKISDKIGIPEAATITVNPPTAYRMLKDFVALKAGDTIIQNGANSAAGQAVHQLCKAWGINSVGVVRDRPEIKDLRNYLKCLGATEVLIEEELRTTKIFESQLKKPILGLNCVGGKNAMEVIGNKNPTFIEQRRKELEEYIQNLLGVFRITMPRIFVEFLELNKYDIIYLLHDLAQYFCTSGENLLWSAKEYNFSSLELHAISDRVRLPCPPNDDNNNYDFSHILDFCSQIGTIIITPSKSFGELKDNVEAIDSPIGTSNLKPANLSFDLNVFRNLNTLKVYGVSTERISDISVVKKLLREFHVHNTPVTRINQILMCDLLHKNKEIGSVEKWDHIERLNLSENQIAAIDESITLAPKVKVLDLSQNRLTNISNLSSLPELRELNLSANLISDCVDWNVKLGLRKMYSLVNLDLSCNIIEDLDEIANIACLPLLENLILTGNPLAGSVDYRPRVLARFDDRASDICLDNEKGTPKELDMALVLAALNNSTKISRT